jgi:outer membrane lipase/esterase
MKSNIAASPRRSVSAKAASIAAFAALVLLASCGGGTSTESPLVPTRAIAFGDGVADVGQDGGKVYSVKDGSMGTWVQQAAANYGLSTTAQSAGGQGWARGNARIALKPDAAGVASTLTVNEQVDAFLASNSIGSDDVIFLSAGTSDLLVQAAGVIAGSVTPAQGVANVEAAAKALSLVARRLVDAGAQHVVVTGLYNMGKSPYAASTGQAAFLSSASSAFNIALAIELDARQVGGKVLYVDAELQYNLFVNQPENYGFGNVATAACTTPAEACTPATIIAGADYNTYVFADGIYVTPIAQRRFGDVAYLRMKSLW